MDKQGIIPKPHIIYSTLTDIVHIPALGKVNLLYFFSPRCPGTKPDRFETDVASHSLQFQLQFLACMDG